MSTSNNYFDLYPISNYKRASIFNDLYNIQLGSVVGGVFNVGMTITSLTSDSTGLVINYNTQAQKIDLKVTGTLFTVGDTIQAAILDDQGNIKSLIYAEIISITAYNPAAVSVDVQARDLLVRFDFSESIKASATNFYPYLWADYDRADSFAYKYYGSSSYYWIIMLSNETADMLFDFTLNQTTFAAYLVLKYADIVIQQNGYTQSYWDALSTDAKQQLINDYLVATPYSYYYYYDGYPDTIYNTDLVGYNYYTQTGPGTYAQVSADATAALALNPLAPGQTPPTFPTVTIPDPTANPPVKGTVGIISTYQYEQYLNEKKRSVSLLDNDYTSTLLSEFKISMGSVVSQQAQTGDI